MTLRPYILAGAVLLAACADSTAPAVSAAPTTPASAGIQFSRTVALGEFTDTIAAKISRVEIRVVPGTLMASRLEIERPHKTAESEKIESRVTAINRSAASVTLALGGLTVGFDAATRFRDERDSSITQDEFVHRVEDALAAGRSPGVEAKREPAAAPQNPSDPTFLANELELSNDPENEIDLNITKANLVVNDAPPPDAWVTVLGIRIAVQTGTGETELRARLPEQGEGDNEADNEGEHGENQVGTDVEFRANVTAVHLATRSVTLDDGTIVEIVTATEFAMGGDRLTSLEAVGHALAAGAVIEARGEGLLDLAAPRTIVAIEIRLRAGD